MTENDHVRFCNGGGVGDCPADRNCTEKSTKVGLKAKRHKAAWDDSYLLKALSL